MVPRKRSAVTEAVGDCSVPAESVQHAKTVSSSELFKPSLYILATSLSYPLLVTSPIQVYVHDVRHL